MSDIDNLSLAKKIIAMCDYYLGDGSLFIRCFKNDNYSYVIDERYFVKNKEFICPYCGETVSLKNKTHLELLESQYKNFLEFNRFGISE